MNEFGSSGQPRKSLLREESTGTCSYDTNVYSEIAKGIVQPEDEAALREALTSGTIVARLSLANIEELVAELNTDRQAMIAKLRTARSLVGFHGMLKQPRDILTEAIQAYADCTEAPSVTRAEPERRRIVGYLSEVIAGSTRHDHVLAEAVAGVNTLKGDRLATMREGGAEALAELKCDSRDPGDRLAFTFGGYWKAAAELIAEDFARPPGCAAACHRRGLDGLLAVRPVRLGVGVLMSQRYEQVVGRPDQPNFRLANRNDGYDLWHAILASTADVFMTFDKRLADHCDRVPAVDGFHVARSVQELWAAR